jgi:hypothetical protein
VSQYYEADGLVCSKKEIYFSRLFEVEVQFPTLTARSRYITHDSSPCTSIFVFISNTNIHGSSTLVHHPTMTSTTYRAIRAKQTPTTVTVYQAYPAEIADPALEAHTFVPPFSRDRMTWIKPSFLWMAYRSGWATKPRQERVLAIEITREGFEWALRNCCLSHYSPSEKTSQEEWRKKLRASPVRVQWDPERDLSLRSVNTYLWYSWQRLLRIDIFDPSTLRQALKRNSRFTPTGGQR